MSDEAVQVSHLQPFGGRLGDGLKYKLLGTFLIFCYFFNDFLFHALTSHGAPYRRVCVPKQVFPCREAHFEVLLILYHLGDFRGPEIEHPIRTKIANDSKIVQDRKKVTFDHLQETGVGLSESVAILVAMATGMGETLLR